MRRVRGPILVVLVLLLLAALAAGVLFGGRTIAPSQLLSEDSTIASVAWKIRLPRVLLAMVAGGLLSIAGLAFQTLFRNPLAEPYTLGVAGGAALGAVLAVQFLPADWSTTLPVVAAASFAGAGVVTLLLLALARRGMGLDTSTLLLAGIAISLSCSAIILFIQYLADFTRTFRMVRWMMGGLAVVGYGEVLWLLPWLFLGLLVLVVNRWELDSLLTGEEVAASRGVDVARLRLTVLMTSSAMVGAMVAVTGPIGFVGLIVPHIMRRLVGNRHHILLPASLIAGGAFLAWCDVASRTVLRPAELPVGVLTALLGGPFFLWLLVVHRRGAQ